MEIEKRFRKWWGIFNFINLRWMRFIEWRKSFWLFVSRWSLQSLQSREQQNRHESFRSGSAMSAVCGRSADSNPFVTLNLGELMDSSNCPRHWETFVTLTRTSGCHEWHITMFRFIISVNRSIRIPETILFAFLNFCFLLVTDVCAVYLRINTPTRQTAWKKKIF